MSSGGNGKESLGLAASTAIVVGNCSTAATMRVRISMPVGR